MKLHTLENADLDDKVVLYRAPYDIDVEETNNVLVPVDDMRIKATIPTLRYLLKKNCKIVILTYVGRPDGQVVERLRTTPHARRLAEILDHPVAKVDECVGPEVDAEISKMSSGDILMLENVRFHSEEMMDDEDFAKELCVGKDVIVFDGFPQAHRTHASTTGIQRHLDSYAGRYLEQEVSQLSSLLDHPEHPFSIIIGGAKISDKVDAIRNLLPRADTILIGGAVANVFLKAQDRAIGDSFIEDVFVDKAKHTKHDLVEVAKDILVQAQNLGKKIIIPSDLVISDDSSVRTISGEDEVPAGFRALDIGPKSQSKFSDIISESKTVFINGPMGKFEDKRFAEGSKIVIESIKKMDGQSIIAGGDTMNLINEFAKPDDFSHISLAGGATLEFLAGKELPALTPLWR